MPLHGGSYNDVKGIQLVQRLSILASTTGYASCVLTSRVRTVTTGQWTQSTVHKVKNTSQIL